MSAGVCVDCAELVEGSPRGGCPRCGKRLARGRTEIHAWESARQEARILAWKRDGVIDEELAKRLRSRVALDAGASTDAKENESESEKAKANASAVERGADIVVGGAGNFCAEMAARWKRLAENVERDAPKEAHEEASLQHCDRTLEVGRAIFARDGRGAVVAAGLEALSALDDDEAAPRDPNAEAPENALKEATKPLGALQVFWFIGTLLVLAGSVMGVREAWRTLEGVWLPVVIAGALFAYHVLFVGLARLLVRRSTVTGRVLAGIAAGLLPVVFVAAAVSIGQ